MTKKQIYLLEEYYNTLRKSKDIEISPIIVDIIENSNSTTQTVNSKRIIPASTTIKDVKRAKDNFVNCLTSNQRQKLTGNTEKYILENRSPYKKYTNRNYDISWARRWIFQNTLRLGWEHSMHGRFDVDLYRYDHMRGSSDIARIERIGKKYQWISLHQLMALASSKYYLKNKWYTNTLPIVYSNSLDFNNRNFDPTIPVDWVIDRSGHLRQTNSKESTNQTVPWWKPDHSILDEDKWLMDVNDIPSLEQLINLTNNNKQYISLINWPTWTKNYGSTRWRQFWIQVSSFIVKIDDLQKIKDWCDSEDFNSAYDNFPMLESCDDVFLGEIIKNTPVHRVATQDMLAPEYSTDKRPFSVMATTTEYNGGDFELGPIMQHRVEMPSPFLRDILELKGDNSIVYTNEENDYCIFSPSLSTESDDQRILLASSNIIESLINQRYTILWTEIGEKRDLGELRSSPDSVCIRGCAYIDEKGNFIDNTKFYKISEKFKR